MNYTAKIDLKKLSGYRCSIKGKSGDLVEGVFLPIKKNDIYVSTDEQGKDKGYYLDLMVWQNKEPLVDEKNGRKTTHGIKPSPRNYKELTDEQKKEIPFVGSLVEFTKEAPAAPTAEVEQAPADDDLPF